MELKDGLKKMNYLQNLHTHTTYCDGKNTPRELLDTAIRKGFDSIGFSGHSVMTYSPFSRVTYESTAEYKKEINRLKIEYADKIKVFLGLEFDMFSDDDYSGLDYTIGSVHYLQIGNKKVGFDRDIPSMQKVIDERFYGNGMEFAKSYYRHMAELPEHYSYDIIGHFDLVNKHGRNASFFDDASKEYKTAAIEAAEALSGKIPFFEVNTGCMPRGYRNFPYPAPFIVKEMKRLGFGAVITSDCHNAEYLDAGYDMGRELLISCGFKEYYILTDKGFVPMEL